MDERSEMEQTLRAGLARLELPVSEDKIEKLLAFALAVTEKNKVMNLTAITAPAQVAQLHLLDSLSLCKVLPMKGRSLLDVGTGAGFPGVPLKIAEPELRLTLLDSLQKRMNWLENEALPALDIPARFLCGRAEEFAAKQREKFDIVTSRAVARLQVLCELCLPFVRVGGYFLAMKGADTAGELAEAKRAITSLGATVERVEEYPIADTLHRVIVLRKTAITPPQYPRSFARIKQKPL